MGHAYTKGERDTPPPRRALRIPRHLKVADESGREMCILLGPPTWGEHDSGMWWSRTFHSKIVGMGWQPAEGVPCLYYISRSAFGHVSWAWGGARCVIRGAVTSDEGAARRVAVGLTAAAQASEWRVLCPVSADEKRHHTGHSSDV